MGSGRAKSVQFKKKKNSCAMTPFPFADAPGRKKSLHENVYEFPIAQLQVLDLVVKKEDGARKFVIAKRA